MFEKIDSFVMQWLETANSGIAPISEAIRLAVEFVFNLFWVIMALLIMVFTFPFWLLGKVRAQQGVHSTAAGVESAGDGNDSGDG